MENNILKGGYLDFNQKLSIHRFVEECMKPLCNQTAQIDFESGSSLTFGDIMHKSDNFSHYLKMKGISENDVVALCSSNCLEYFWIVLGILKCGAVCEFLNPSSSLRELEHLMETAKPVLVMCSSDIAECIHDGGVTTAEFLLKLSSVREVIVWNGLVQHCTRLPDMSSAAGKDSLLTNHATNREYRSEKINNIKPCEDNLTMNYSTGKEGSPAFIFNSSGSTGLPKCVLLTHKNIVATLANRHIFVLPENVALGLMPFYHTYGFTLMLMCLCQGAKVIIMPHFSKTKFIRGIEKYKVNCLHLVPYLLAMLCKDDAFSNFDLRPICQIWTGAGFVNSKMQYAIKERLDSCGTLYHSYGMTETTFVMFCAECRTDKPQSCGKLIPGMECKVVDMNSAISLGPHEVGEICFRGPMIMDCYMNNEKATKETLDDEGWLHSGDLGYYDTDGYFYIVDRFKELIKYKSHQISPSELESVLTMHPAVQDAAVVGVPHELYGELPRAVIVRAPGADDSADDIQRFFDQEVAPYKKLRGGIVFVPAIPRTGAGKIQRRLLQKMI